MMCNIGLNISLNILPFITYWVTCYISLIILWNYIFYSFIHIYLKYDKILLKNIKLKLYVSTHGYV
jgi:hypothetical protein